LTIASFKVIIMTMIVTNIYEVKARLSEYLEAVSRGERVVICKRNTPVAELRAIAPARTELRKVGGAAGRMTVGESFFLPLPEEALIDFEGATRVAGVSMVAEKRPTPYGPRRVPRAKSRKRS
jgi:prevent-host-death family protein